MKYEIQYKLQSLDFCKIGLLSRMEGATITGLEPATAYLVRARTVTAQFASAHTRALLALTLHEPPARAPLNLRAAAPRPSTIELVWQVGFFKV